METVSNIFIQSEQQIYSGPVSAWFVEWFELKPKIVMERATARKLKQEDPHPEPDPIEDTVERKIYFNSTDDAKNKADAIKLAKEIFEGGLSYLGAPSIYRSHLEKLDDAKFSYRWVQEEDTIEEISSDG